MENKFFYYKREINSKVLQLVCFEWINESLKLISSETFYDCKESFSDLKEIELSEFQDILGKQESFLATKSYPSFGSSSCS